MSERLILGADGFNSASEEAEIKRAHISVIRGWNISSGQMVFYVTLDDHITSIGLSSDNAYLLSAGTLGQIIGWNTQNGTREFIRAGHSSGIFSLSVLPIVIKKGRKSNGSLEDDSGVFAYTSQATGVGASRSSVSLSTSNPPLQFLTLGNDDLVNLWSLPGVRHEFDIDRKV